jgi:hypothetical protein
MKSLNDLCNDYPEYADTARSALAHAHKLNDRINEMERFPNDMWTYKKEVRELRAEYNEFYKSEIIESKNPIIQELNVQ